jgi:hypothetical protein
MFTRGWRFAIRMTSHTFMPRSWQIIESSFANAMFRSRKLFSTSLHSSAVRASVAITAPLTNVS